jgi:hypothetical protein
MHHGHHSYPGGESQARCDPLIGTLDVDGVEPIELELQFHSEHSELSEEVNVPKMIVPPDYPHLRNYFQHQVPKLRWIIDLEDLAFAAAEMR